MSQDPKNNSKPSAGDAKKGDAPKGDASKGDAPKGNTSGGDASKGNGAKDGAKEGGAGGAKKALTISISFSTVTTFCVVLLGCVCMAFVMGVIVGRGDNPESHLPAITALLPEDGAVTAQEDKELTEVMPKEELDYSSELKQRIGLEDEVPAEEPVKPLENQSVEDASTLPKSMSGQTVLTVPDSQVVQEMIVPMDEPQEPTTFDYIFQVATFTDEASVDRLRERLEGKGLRTKMEKSGKFFKVMVLMRGSAEQAEGLRALMVEMKLGNPLQRGKKAVQ